MEILAGASLLLQYMFTYYSKLMEIPSKAFLLKGYWMRRNALDGISINFEQELHKKYVLEKDGSSRKELCDATSLPGCLASSCDHFLFNSYSKLIQNHLLAALPPPVIIFYSSLIQNRWKSSLEPNPSPVRISYAILVH